MLACGRKELPPSHYPFNRVRDIAGLRSRGALWFGPVRSGRRFGLRARSRTIAANLWADRVVPVAMEAMVMALKVEGAHFGLAHLDAGGVGIGIDLALHLETGVRGGGGDQLDDGLVADQRLAAPVLAQTI